jgi:iron complex transport system ATP-binding protein
LLDVDDITCYYGAVKVLEEVGLVAGKGEVFGLIGPNGSGKTTLFRCMSRIVEPEKGRIVMAERDIKDLGGKELAKDLAVVSQDPRPDVIFTALDVVMMGRSPHVGRFETEGQEDLEAVHRAMEKTRTAKLADRPVNELSGGERQRVFIARALAQEPRLLLLDEPTSNLDISSQIEILSLVKDMAERDGLTVVVALHDLNLAARYCDRMALLSGGKIVSTGTPAEVMTPGNIKEAFKVDVVVKKHDLTASIYVTPIPIQEGPARGRGLKVHLICGAGSGSYLMGFLKRQGYEVSAGVLNVLDTDYETARSMGLALVEEAPFSPITESAHDANMLLIDASDAVVLASPPFGPGNMLNLVAVKYALDKGKPTMVYKEPSPTGHDFRYPRAAAILEEIEKRGVKTISGPEELIDAIEEGGKGK